MTYRTRDAADLMTAHLDLIARDIGAWLDLFAEDAVVEFPYAASLHRDGRFEGKAAIDGYFRGTPGTFRDLRFRDVRLHRGEDPDRVVAEVHGSALVGPNARPYEQDYVMVLRAKDGKIASYREYWNPLPYLEAQK